MHVVRWMRKPVFELSNVLWTVCACHIKTSWWTQVQTRCRPGVDNAADQAKYHAVAWSLAWSAAWSTLGLHLVCTWSAPLSTNWPAFDTYTLNILDMSIASYESHSQYALVFLHRAFLCLCHKTVLQCFRNRIRTWTIANTMYELEANIHLNFQHTFLWIGFSTCTCQIPNTNKNNWMCISHGGQGGQLQSRCTKVHTHTNQRTIHCTHAPLVHARTVLRMPHMSACAMQCAYPLMNIHVRLQSTHQIQRVTCVH